MAKLSEDPNTKNGPEVHPLSHTPIWIPHNPQQLKYSRVLNPLHSTLTTYMYQWSHTQHPYSTIPHIYIIPHTQQPCNPLLHTASIHRSHSAIDKTMSFQQRILATVMLVNTLGNRSGLLQYDGRQDVPAPTSTWQLQMCICNKLICCVGTQDVITN